MITSVSYGTKTVYAEPEKVISAINAKISKNISEEVLYSDDSVEDTLTTFDGVDVEIEATVLHKQTRAKTHASKYVKGTIVESKDDIPPEIALGFRA